MESIEPNEKQYQQVLERLYNRLPAFHRVGATAYKPGLETARELSAAFGDPHRRFKSVHVGGTNGKGSTAHTLAAILTSAGYRTGLYTSPHLVDFAERIRVDGQPINHDYVVDFVRDWEGKALDCDPSFFELATVMAMDYFAHCGVDIAVIEVGLGGRLDTTNIITPELAVVTNVSLDHTALLGDTVEAIAAEKAGIFKPGVPALVGESDASCRLVFQAQADRVGCQLTFAQDEPEVVSALDVDGYLKIKSRKWGEVDYQLVGDCQKLNANTVLKAVNIMVDRGWDITADAVRRGMSHVCDMTGLMGRWMKLSADPVVFCDTGHNPGAWQYLAPRLEAIARECPLKVVLGFVGDKDFRTIIPSLPRQAEYYMVTASTPRAESADVLTQVARSAGLKADAYDSVEKGYHQAADDGAAEKNSVIFVGGSTFVVADLLLHVKF